MKNTDLTEQWSVMQKMFLPTSAFSAPLQENARRFWESQEKVLDSMQALANGWFERRLRNSLSARSRRAYERNRDICGYDPGVSGLGRRSIRADHGRRAFLPATNHGDNRRARSAANSAFGKRKGGRTRSIQVEGPNPLQDYVIGVLRKVTRMSALGQKRTSRQIRAMSAFPPNNGH